MRTDKTPDTSDPITCSPALEDRSIPWPSLSLRLVLVCVAKASCKHNFLFPSSSSQGQVMHVDQPSAKRLQKTQNKWPKQQGGCAGNALTQPGRLWDLHAIHLSNCIRANSDCCGIGTASVPREPEPSPPEVSVAVSRRVVRVLQVGGGEGGGGRGCCCSTQQQQQQQQQPQKHPPTEASRWTITRSTHVPHVPHPVLCAASTAARAGRACRSLPSLTVHMCCKRAKRLRASTHMRAIRDSDSREAFDTKPPRVSLFFITGTEIGTRRDSHALVSSLGGGEGETR